MPFDGISFTDAAYKITLPSERNIQAEVASQAEAKTFVKKLDESHKVDQDGKNKKEQEEKKKEEEEKQENLESQDESSADFVKKSEKIQKYKVSFNQNNEMVELVDRKTGKIVETISPNDLLTLVSKSKSASGILVDRKI
jgi:uncharacterized FlaG/YvyC family protein